MRRGFRPVFTFDIYRRVGTVEKSRGLVKSAVMVIRRARVHVWIRRFLFTTTLAHKRTNRQWICENMFAIERCWGHVTNWPWPINKVIDIGSWKIPQWLLRNTSSAWPLTGKIVWNAIDCVFGPHLFDGGGEPSFHSIRIVTRKHDRTGIEGWGVPEDTICGSGLGWTDSDGISINVLFPNQLVFFRNALVLPAPGHDMWSFFSFQITRKRRGCYTEGPGRF